MTRGPRAGITRPVQWIGAATRSSVGVFAVGAALEAVAMILLSGRVLDAIDGQELPGTSGSIGVTIAILAGLAGGPLVGAGVAGVGWALFAGLVAQDYDLWSTAVALPLWVGIALVVGLVSDRLVELVRERERAHGRRTPLATVAGIAEIVRTTEDEALREKLLGVIEQTARDELERTDAERAPAARPPETPP